MRRDARTDGNQKAIVEYIRSIGGLVLHLHALKNCCDILVGFRGVIYLFEIKNGAKKKLTPGEAEFFREWMGYNLHVVAGIEDVNKVLNIKTK